MQARSDYCWSFIQLSQEVNAEFGWSSQEAVESENDRLKIRPITKWRNVTTIVEIIVTDWLWMQTNLGLFDSIFPSAAGEFRIKGRATF